MKKPVEITADWTESDAEESPGEAITKRGQHHLANFVAKKREENAERRAKDLRDYRGEIPPPEYQESGRTWKSSSRIRRPSALFRRNFEAIDWSRT